MRENILTIQTQTEALNISDLFNEVVSCGCNVIVCPSVRFGLTMVKFSYSLVWHRETAVYAVK